jgi:1-acyl-sn-glycerol-3-phosphate acyltransferase
MIYWITRIAARLVLSMRYRIDIKGGERLPRDKAFVLLPKHQRWQDVPLVALSTPLFLTYVAKYELFINPLGRHIITALGGIPLNRKRPIETRRTLYAIRYHLQRNRGLVIFPEGTYYPGTMGPGNHGILRFIITSADVPLIPVGIRYSTRQFRPRVRIRFGEPIHADDGIGSEELLSVLMKKIAELSDLAQPVQPSMQAPIVPP